MEQRAATAPLQRTRFWLVLLSSAHVIPAAFISASVLLRQVCFGRPTLRFPCGFQSRACLVMLDAGFRSVWPIQPHLRFLISVSIGVCFVLSHSCSFETTSGHLMLRIVLRHLLVNVCNLWVLETDPYYLLTKREQVTVFRLRTGHNHLNYHLYSKLCIGHTEQCPCGTGSQTTEHLLQSCPTYQPLRKGIWPDHTPVAHKLYSRLGDL